MDDRYLTTSEVAKQLGYSKRKVRKLCQRGLLIGAVQEYKYGPWCIPITSVEDIKVRGLPVQSGKKDQPEPPTWWLRFRYNPRVFYPTLIVSVLFSVSAIIFAAISAGADLENATKQIQEWGLVSAFPSSSEDEVLIIVSKFHRSEGVPDTEPHEKIRRAIADHASELGFSHVRVEIDPRVLTQDDSERARELAIDHGASMIIWGEDTGVELVVNFLTLGDSKTIASEFQVLETGERGRTFHIQKEAYAQLITQELPLTSTFLSFLAIGKASIESEKPNDGIVALEAALALVDQISVSQPEQLSQQIGSAHFDLGIAKWGLGEYEASIKHFNESIALNHHLGIAYNNRAAYAALGQYEDAIRDFEQAVVHNCKCSNLYLNRGNIYSIIGQYEDAIRDYDQAVALDPQTGDALLNQGAAYAALGQYENAIRSYDQAVIVNPQLGDAFFNRGNAHAALGQYKTAIRDHSQAISVGFWTAYNNRGTAHVALGQYETAIADFTQAIAHDPEKTGAYLNRGDAYTYIGQYEAAIADYTKAIDLDPKNSYAYLYRGFAYAKIDHRESAISDTTQAIAIDPQLGIAYYNRGASYTAIGQSKAAIDDFNQAIALDPMDSDAYAYRGSNYVTLGQYEIAIADFNQAIDINPQNVSAFFNRGSAYTTLGRCESAIDDFNQAIKLAPNSIVAVASENSIAELKATCEGD